MTERPLRFCMITTFYPPYSFGGDAIYVQQLALELARRGHCIEVIHCVDSYTLLAHGESLRSFQEHPNIIVHRLASPWGALSPLATQQTGYPLFKTREIEAILARGFDVIHYHNISLIGGPKILELGEGVKLYTAHEYWLVCPTNVLFRYDGVACEETKCLRCTLAYHRPPQWWRYGKMMGAAVQNLDMLIHLSQFSLEKHRAMGLQAPAATVMNYFRSMPEAGDEDNATISLSPVETPYFLCIGRLELLKGVHTLIPLFQNYGRARLVVVGEGGQMEELKRMAGDCPNIEFLGWLDYTQLSPLYTNAVALIVPSLCYENGPLVMVEAYQHHTPVLVRNIGSLPDLVNEIGSGATFTDEDSLRTLMDELLDHPALRADMGERGYAAYKSQYTPEAHLRRYFEIIYEVMERKEGYRVSATDEKVALD